MEDFWLWLEYAQWVFEGGPYPCREDEARRWEMDVYHWVDACLTWWGFVPFVGVM